MGGGIVTRGNCQYDGSHGPGKPSERFGMTLCAACVKRKVREELSIGWDPSGEPSMRATLREEWARIEEWTCSFGCKFTGDAHEGAQHLDKCHPAEMAAWWANMKRKGARKPSAVPALKAEIARLRKEVDALRKHGVPA
jgi:hypothetical protein